ncbi:cation transporter [Strigomonas culicis]|uniref:Cation transporter n=1 Tax=Strigomonas culicis TaxID=28005 RepID=S9UKV6_9TRYP|nr:cation transporter [Strigomonas culicis]|eukprot:EPY29404.1 cation transporter [Strigomonas culicis]
MMCYHVCLSSISGEGLVRVAVMAPAVVRVAVIAVARACPHGRALEAPRDRLHVPLALRGRRARRAEDHLLPLPVVRNGELEVVELREREEALLERHVDRVRLAVAPGRQLERQVHLAVIVLRLLCRLRRVGLGCLAREQRVVRGARDGAAARREERRVGVLDVWLHRLREARELLRRVLQLRGAHALVRDEGKVQRVAGPVARQEHVDRRHALPLHARPKGLQPLPHSRHLRRVLAVEELEDGVAQQAVADLADGQRHDHAGHAVEAGDADALTEHAQQRDAAAPGVGAVVVRVRDDDAGAGPHADALRPLKQQLLHDDGGRGENDHGPQHHALARLLVDRGELEVAVAVGVVVMMVMLMVVLVSGGDRWRGQVRQEACVAVLAALYEQRDAAEEQDGGHDDSPARLQPADAVREAAAREEHRGE